MAANVVYDRLVFYPGDEIFVEGDEGNWAYLIQSGEIEITKRKPNGGGEVRLALLGTGRVFGEMALIDEVPRMASARATAKTTLVLIDSETFMSKIRKADPLVRELLYSFTSNLRALGRKHVEDAEATPAKAPTAPGKAPPAPAKSPAQLPSAPAKPR